MIDEERPSKTQRKKQMHELQALGERLLTLNAGQLDAIGLPDDLRTAVAEVGHATARIAPPAVAVSLAPAWNVTLAEAMVAP
jgi:ribosomal 50S subunit-associated protein YjgA (DUF615 family)